MIQGDDAPGFFIRHFVKDMGIALSAAEAMGMKTPGLDMAYTLYKQMEDHGRGFQSTQALFHLLVSSKVKTSAFRRIDLSLPF